MENALDFGTLLCRVVGSLAVVLAVLFASLHYLRRMARFRGKIAPGSRIRLLARQSVGPKHHLLMVEAAEQLLLLGVSPEGIRLLSPLARVAQPASQDESAQNTAELDQGFQNLLEHMSSAKT